MRPIVVSRILPAPRQQVWDDIARLETHSEWMADAAEIEFLGESRSGLGTRMRVDTRVGPLRTSDVMEFITWDPPHRMGIRHEGIVSGVGEFRLEDLDGSSTLFVWEERLTFPWYLGGAPAAFAARPILTKIWEHNLGRLARRFG